MSKKLIIGLLLAVTVYIFPTSAEAKIDIAFSSPPILIQMDESFEVEISVSGADPEAEYYIRGVFYKPDTTQYFGYTQNNIGEWNKDSSAFTQFYKVTGNTATKISFKPDTESSHLTPNARYLFKVGRYTPGGSLTWSDQSPSTLYISTATDTITPTLSPTLTMRVTPLPTSIPSATLTPTPSAPPTPVIDLLTVKLSEIMACPNSGEEEWIELKNQSAMSITISDWKLKDSTDSHTVSVQGNLSSYGHVVIPISSSLFNNGGDSVRLFNESGQIIDQMAYTSCSTGSSFIRVDNQWQTTKTPSKGLENVYHPLTTNTPTATTPVTSTPKEESEDIISPDIPEQQTTELYSEGNDSIALPQNNVDVESSEVIQESESTNFSTISAQPNNSPINFMAQSNAFLLGGCSYIISAALLAQKWYTITSA